MTPETIEEFYMNRRSQHRQLAPHSPSVSHPLYLNPSQSLYPFSQVQPHFIELLLWYFVGRVLANLAAGVTAQVFDEA